MAARKTKPNKKTARVGGAALNKAVPLAPRVAAIRDERTALREVGQAFVDWYHAELSHEVTGDPGPKAIAQLRYAARKRAQSFLDQRAAKLGWKP